MTHTFQILKGFVFFHNTFLIRFPPLFFSPIQHFENILDSIFGRFSNISVGLITSNEKGKNRQYVTASFGTLGLMLFELQKVILKQSRVNLFLLDTGPVHQTSSFLYWL